MVDVESRIGQKPIGAIGVRSPSSDLVSLCDVIEAPTLTLAGSVQRVKLLERTVESAMLAHQWGKVDGGVGSVLFISGESGAGKSSLVHAFVETVPPDATVLWGMCDPLTTPRPLGPLHDIADQLDSSVVELVARGAPSQEIFGAVFDALGVRRVVLVIDDLQWADDATLDLFRFLLRRIGLTRTLLIGVVRTDDVGQSRSLQRLLGEGARSEDCSRLDVGPLSIAGVTSMIGDRGIDPQRVHELTGGNAFFVTEVLSQGGEEPPSSVRDAVMARTVDLDDEARSVLDLMACAPEGIGDRLLPGLGVGLGALRALDAVGFIGRTRRGVGFRHEICRRVIADAIPPGGAVGLHLRILEAIEGQPSPDPAVLVHHALAVGDADRVFTFGSRAGRLAVRSGAHTEACAFFESALVHGGPRSVVDEAELLELLATELYLVDRLEDSIEAGERALSLHVQLGDLASVSRDHQSLSVFHWYNANPVVANEHAGRAVAVLDGTQHRRQLGHALALQAYLALQRSDWEQARALTDAARAIALEENDEHLRARLDLIDSLEALVDGDLEARSRLLALLGAGSPLLKDVNSTGYSNLAYLEVEQRRFTAAAEVLAIGLPLTIEPDIPICHVWQMGARSRLHLMQGGWSEAAADAEAVLGVRSAPLARTWPHIVRGLVLLRRGHPGADAELEEAWRLASRFGEPLRLLPATSALVERAWLTGVADSRVVEAVDILKEVEGPDLGWSVGELAVWLRRLGRPVELGAHHDRLNAPHALDLADDAEAAAAAWQALSSPYDQALSLYDSHEPDVAVTSVPILDGLGAEAVASKVRFDLRTRGISKVPSVQRASTRANPAGLTARQVEVLQLLEQGLTNAELAERLFISPKTADHHVSAILPKLHASSRREAVRNGRALGIL